MEVEESTRHIRKARELFFTGSELPHDVAAHVRPEIMRSWCRSRLSGADPTVPTLVYRGDMDPASKLRLAATPVFDRLTLEFDGLPMAIYLADAEGTTIHRWVQHAEMRRRLEAIQSEVGMNCSEEYVGTNGSGTAIEDRCTVQVYGPEHYAEALQVFTCASSPIFRPATRQVAGAITLTCRDRDVNTLLAPLVSQVAAEIGERLFLERTMEERLLLHEFVASSRRFNGAVVAISENMVITNPPAARLIEGTEQAVLWEHAAKLAHEHRTESRLQLLRGEVVMKCRPLYDGARTIGMVLELEPVERPTRPGSVWRVQHGRFARTLVGQSAAWLRVDHAARQASEIDRPLLIRGEPGVGKNALVRAIHADTDRWGPIKVVDAARLPVDGLGPWIGQVQAALEEPTGVVVLDHLEHVDEMVAGVLSSLIDTRQSSASGRVVGLVTTSMTEAVGLPQGLADRLGATVIDVPPLRDRPEDIPELLTALTRRLSGRPTCPDWSPNAMQALSRLTWQGNVRELENVVGRVLVQRPIGTITVDDLPAEVRARSHRYALTQMERAEVETIVAALIEAGGNKAVAASALGISRSTLYRKLRGYGLDLDRLTY